jgi:hypothetical protein
MRTQLGMYARAAVGSPATLVSFADENVEAVVIDGVS